MPGKETEGFSTNQPEANIASKQNADPNFADNESDVDPEHLPEVEKAYQKNVGSNKLGNDRRNDHDSNTRQMGS
jgi:hypothetical protein